LNSTCSVAKIIENLNSKMKKDKDLQEKLRLQREEEEKGW
jgi:hypothetical protein